LTSGIVEPKLVKHLRTLQRLRLCLAGCFLGVAVCAPASLGWSQTYEQNANWGPGSWKISAKNSITYNYVSFGNPYGGLPQMGTTLCNSAGTSCYTYRWSNTGLLTDERSISYGFAECRANVGNQYVVLVYYCATGNG
jgi:hypothetical protein